MTSLLLTLAGCNLISTERLQDRKEDLRDPKTQPQTTSTETTTGCQNWKTYYYDEDQDGFGDLNQSQNFCTDDTAVTSSWSPISGDCDDSNSSINPNQNEIPCDSFDNDCELSSTDQGAVLKDINSTVVGHFPSLQEAYDNALDFDSIEICEGTYHENLIFNRDIDLSLTGLGPKETVIFDGDDIESVLKISAGQTDITSMSFTNGEANSGGGLHITANASVNLYDVSINNNVALTGGGIFVEELGELILDSSEVSDNTANKGAGLFARGYNEVSHSRFERNIGVESGAIELEMLEDITHEDNTFRDNVYQLDFNLNRSSCYQISPGSNYIVAPLLFINGISFYGNLDPEMRTEFFAHDYEDGPLTILTCHSNQSCF